MAKRQQRGGRRPVSPPAGTVEIIDLSALKADPDNAREHTPRNIGVIGDSLQETGAWRSIGIDEDDTVRMGNGVMEAAAERGFTRVIVVESDGQSLVAVRRRDLTPEQKRKAALADNRAGEFSTWSLEALKALQAHPEQASGLFTPEELARLVIAGDKAAARAAGPAAFAAVDEDLPTEHTCPKCGYAWSGKG